MQIAANVVAPRINGAIAGRLAGSQARFTVDHAQSVERTLAATGYGATVTNARAFWSASRTYPGL